MINPKKSLSQNFLKDKNICKKIVSEANIKNNLVLEIGPGYGILTDFILKEKPKKFILVEKDKEIFKFLKKKYSNNENIILHNKDILNFNFKDLNNLIVISNLPYNISSKIILNLFKNSEHCKEAILMVQKEMALKFDYSLKKLNKYKFLNKLFCHYKRCFDVSPNVFYPRPKVTSSVIKFNFRLKSIDYNNAIKFSSIIFKNKRKKISNNISISEKEVLKIANKRVDEINISEMLMIYNFF